MNDRQSDPPRDEAGGDGSDSIATHAQPPARGVGARRIAARDSTGPAADLGLDLDQAPERNLEFEEAARARDRLAELKKRVFGVELAPE